MIFSNIGSCADDIAMINSMVSDFPEHTNANYFLHTGIGIQGRPSMGAWINYGLEAKTKTYGYVVLNGGLTFPEIWTILRVDFTCFLSGFCVSGRGLSYSQYQTPENRVLSFRIQKLRLMQRMDKHLLGKIGHADQIESAITNYELAYRMQASVPEMADISGESAATKNFMVWNPAIPIPEVGAQLFAGPEGW
ncbi:MAG: DUF1501 domain-containing protein [Bacteroidia bacterium]